MSERSEMVKVVINDIIGEQGKQLKEFFLDAMPAEGELSIILARKAYDLFKVFQVAYPNDFNPFAQRVIHDGNIIEWLSNNGFPSHINVVDDTLFNGKTMQRTLDLLLSFPNIKMQNISSYVFYVNERLRDAKYVSQFNEDVVKEKNKRTIFHLFDKPKSEEKRIAVHTAMLYKDYGIRVENAEGHMEQTLCSIYYVCPKERGELRATAHRFIELIHAASEPYVTYFPTYELSMDKDAGLLYEGAIFPKPDSLLSSKLKSDLVDKIDIIFDTTFNAIEAHGIHSFVMVLKNTSDYERITMLRLYANYNQRRVLIIPYSIFKPYVTSAKINVFDHLGEKQESFYSILQGYLLCNAQDNKIREENNKALFRMIRYVRAMEIAERLIGGEIEEFRRKDDFIDKVFSNGKTSWASAHKLLRDSAIFNWNVSDEIDPSFEDVDAVKIFNEHTIPDRLIGGHDTVHKQAFDLAFDRMSDEKHRTKGVVAGRIANIVRDKILSAYKFYEKVTWDISDLAYTLLVVLCDRGVAIPSTKTKLSAIGFHTDFLLKDGENAVEALSDIPGMFGLPWLVYNVKKRCENKWGEEETGFWEKLNVLGNCDEFRKRIDEVLQLNSDLLGDYIIYPEAHYKFNKWASPPELKLFNDVYAEYVAKYPR